MYGNVSDREGIYYANDERGVLWEFYLSRPFAAGASGDEGEVRFHYVVNYEFERPGVFVVEWLDVDDGHADLGGRASVGMQGGELSFSFFFSRFSFLFSFLFFNGFEFWLTSIDLFTADSNDAVLGFQFSYMTKSIYTGLVMTCDSNANICTTCTKQSTAGQAPTY